MTTAVPLAPAPSATRPIAALLDAAIHGDPASRTEIVLRYRRDVERSVARTGLRAADRQDAVQNTWLRFFEHADAIRDPRSVGGWLAVTARREALTLATRRARERVSGAVPDETAVSDDRTPEASALAADERRTVRAAVAELHGRPADLVDALFFRPESTYADVARDLDIPVGSIGPTRARIMRQLRRRLSDPRR